MQAASMEEDMDCVTPSPHREQVSTTVVRVAVNDHRLIHFTLRLHEPTAFLGTPRASRGKLMTYM